ncbi:MAG: hypothetical protein BEN19_09080 [Epulopiscium sp. Nuni2H_MBin003]|nr:MAG: hypothetical protein BEN19_09080 [Epulopiscium sp. Nuni2H_MBin003]
MSNKNRDTSNVEVGLMITSIVILIAFIILMMTNAEGTISVISSFFWSSMSTLGPFFQLFTFGTFIAALYLAFGKYGKVRLGDCKPEYSTPSYVSMMLLASLASSALYWSFTEWAYYYASPGLGMEPYSVLALENSLSYQFYHWGIVNQAMYTAVGVSIAYGVYVKKVKSFQTSAVCSAMMGDKVKGKSAIGKVIDFAVIFGILGGLSSSLGLGVPLAAGALERSLGIPQTAIVQVGIIVFIACVYAFTSYLGTKKGMKVLTDITTVISICVLLFILLAGPTTFILKNIVSSLGHMIDNTVRMTLFTDPVENTGFAEGWTIYFQAFYLNYVAMMGIFIAKVSKGRTIKEVALATLFGISAGSWIFFGINGSFSISTFLNGQIDVVGLVNGGAGESVIFDILATLPLGAFMPFIILILIVGFLAPSLDSASLALAETVTKEGTPKMAVRMVWCVLLAVIPMSIILTGTSFDAIKYISIIISIPFVVIVTGMQIGLFKWLAQDSRNGVHKANIELQEKEIAAELAQKNN